MAIIVLLLIRVRSRLYKRVMRGFYGAMAISFTVLLIQGLFGQTSFTVSTFLYPVVAMFYITAMVLKSEGFCRDITDIIQGCGVTGDKVALELTESRSDSDFLLMKSKISDLRSQGIKIYLDDFGTAIPIWKGSWSCPSISSSSTAPW